MKQYIGISRDHSGSMAHLKRPAMADYNNTIAALKDASQKNDIDTIVSVVTHQGSINREIVNSSVNSLKTLGHYDTPGGSTPLFDSVNEVINILKAVPDAGKSDVSFLVMAVTDGYDNASRMKGYDLGREIQKLQATDHWTFVFRVPRGSNKRSLENLGIPGGNIQEWDQTEEGFREATEITTQAVSRYYTGLRSGVGATKSFYADMGNVNERKVASKLADISNEVAILPVTRRVAIQDFFENSTFGYYRPGTAFYQLSKTEKRVQKYKMIAVRSKKTGAVYAGPHARTILNLPNNLTFSLKPGDHGDWDIFIQSTSNNRILLPGTNVLYWKNA